MASVTTAEKCGKECKQRYDKCGKECKRVIDHVVNPLKIKGLIVAQGYFCNPHLSGSRLWE